MERVQELAVSQLAEQVLTHIEGDQDLSFRLATLVTQALATSPGLASVLVNGLEQRFPQSVLSDQEIRRLKKEGEIVIEPFRESRVKTSSYDVTLGEYYWTTAPAHPGNHIFNPHNPDHVRDLWRGPFRAKTVREYLSDGKFKEEDFRGLNVDDPIIILEPQETILAHTDEFIGGKRRVTTMMKGRSSWGRAFQSICKDAGWGDVGYFNRWTMEIQNNLVRHWSILPVGQPIAQIVFFRVNRLAEEGRYSEGGSYQISANLAELKSKWRPEMMLPRLTRQSDQEVLVL